MSEQNDQDILTNEEELKSQIDPRFLVLLQGKLYPTWPGVLNAATSRGLKRLEVVLVQAPSAENGQMAICRATAEFEGGLLFSDVGDASPQSVRGAMVPSLLRISSTRAKGRVLRDALNVGHVLLEELPGELVQAALPTSHSAGKTPPEAVAQVAKKEATKGAAAICSGNFQRARKPFASRNTTLR